MKLLRDEIRNHATRMAALGFGTLQIPPGKFFDEEYVLTRIKTKADMWLYRDAVDSAVTNFLAKRCKTFIFSTQTVLGFPFTKELQPGHYIAPFPEMIIQFTHPIPEETLQLTGVMPSGNVKMNDKVAALIIGWPPESGGGPFYQSVDLINIIAYYTSTSLNRAVLYVDGNGEVDYTRAVGGYIPGGKEDKQIIVNLALWCIAYLNSPGIEIEKVAGATEKVNTKRVREGKRKLEDHYILKVRNTRVKYLHQPEEKRVGSKHSYMYDVQSHPRKLPTGKVIIIPAHKRGLDNEEYRPAIRVVGKGLPEEKAI